MPSPIPSPLTETLVVHFSGRDQPGLIASLTAILAEFDVGILDIGQAVVHETLALGLLIEAPREDALPALKTALLAKCGELRLQVGFTPIRQPELDHWVASQGKDRFIITLLGRALSSRNLALACRIVAENNLNVDRIERLSRRLSLGDCSSKSNACIELRVSGQVKSEAAMRAAFLRSAHEEKIDIAFQRESLFQRNRRLFAFDMDSTLIQGEVIDELAKIAGVGDQVAGITEAAMRGEIEFRESFTRRVGLLRGLPESRALDLVGTIPLVEGAEHLIGTLKMLGYKTAILSGGFTFFARHLQRRLGIDYVHANDLDIVDGVVTGLVKTEIVDGPKKAALLRRIAARESISLEQVVAVGDGANDLPMLGIAGMGIAFRAKPLVRESAGHAVSFSGLDSLLYFIGVRDRDLEDA